MHFSAGMKQLRTRALVVAGWWPRGLLLLMLTVLLVGCGSAATLTTGSAGSIPGSVGPTPASTPTSTPQPTVPPVPPANGWDTVAIAVPNASAPDLLSVVNHNYRNDQNAALGGLKLQQPQFDGISPDGRDLLYQLVRSDQTFYYRALRTLPAAGFFFALATENAGNAIWSPDSQTVLIATVHQGVLQVNSLTGVAHAYLPHVGNVRLTFYRAGYLYYVHRDVNLWVPSALYRSPVAGGGEELISQLHSELASYWLSPDGQTVYFANKLGPTGSPGLYAVNSDGSHLRLLRQEPDVTPIGYAADNALLFMRLQAEAFQVVKLGSTPELDQVVLANTAPGAVSLCDSASGGPDLICANDVALAPYGHALVVQGTFANGTHRVWSDDLTMHKQTTFSVGPGAGLLVQLIGWDRLPVG